MLSGAGLRTLRDGLGLAILRLRAGLYGARGHLRLRPWRRPLADGRSGAPRLLIAPALGCGFYLSAQLLERIDGFLRARGPAGRARGRGGAVVAPLAVLLLTPAFGGGNRTEDMWQGHHYQGHDNRQSLYYRIHAECSSHGYSGAKSRCNSPRRCCLLLALLLFTAYVFSHVGVGLEVSQSVVIHDSEVPGSE